jgi:CelD/BcsL family acetyltransferase involved in cellulose biosynthesis
MRVEVVRALELGPAELGRWSKLQQAADVYRSPFFCPAFTLAVARVRDVHVGVIEDANAPAGFFPFEVVLPRHGRPVGRPFSDYHGVVLGEDVELEPRELMRACRLATWCFDHLPAALAAFQPYVLGQGRSPRIDLEQGSEAASSEIRAAARKARKLGREIGPLRFVASTEEAELFDLLVAWKRRQYAHTGVRDVLADDRSRALLRHALESQGMLSVLYAGDQVAGIHLGLRAGGVWHSWFPAYNPALHRYSPGLVLMLELVKAAPALGIAEIDLGKGEARYKQALANGAVTLCEGRVGAHPLAGRVQASARRMVRSAGVHRAVRRALRR